MCLFVLCSKTSDIWKENLLIWRKNTRANKKYNLLTGRWHWRWKGALHLAAAGLVRLDGWGRAPLYLERTNKQTKKSRWLRGPVRCERISGWNVSVQTPNPLSGMAASLKKEIKWISSPLVAQIILHFNAASSGGTNAQPCESFEDNLRIKFSDATFISDGGIILWRKAKVKLRVKDVLEPGAGQSIGLGNPRPINELFRDSQYSQIFTFHSRQLSEGRILSHLFNGKLTLKCGTTGYTICPT